MKSVFWIIFLLCLASCFDQGDCLINSTNLVKSSLLDKNDGTPRLTQFLSIHQLEDDIELINPDSTFTVSSVELPLSPKRNQCSFVFLTSDSATYLLRMNYKTTIRVIAADCGAFQYFQDLSVDSTNFDRIKIISPQLFTSVTKNLEISF